VENSIQGLYLQGRIIDANGYRRRVKPAGMCLLGMLVGLYTYGDDVFDLAAPDVAGGEAFYVEPGIEILG
jgi:hypothetical protein